jgi:hypothetical protein
MPASCGFFVGASALTDFATELRTYCRNPKCRSKLKAPVSNLKEAFCARGCYGQFYHSRCLVCEGSMERRSERQRVCGKRKCRNAFRGRYDLGRYHVSTRVINHLRKSIKSGLEGGTQERSSWHIVAGSELSPDQLRHATVPDGPDGKWSGGEYDKNRSALEAHFAKLDADVSDVCAVCGHGDDLVDRSDARGRWKAVCRGCLGLPEAIRPRLPVNISGLIPADLSIPDFLKRAA